MTTPAPTITADTLLARADRLARAAAALEARHDAHLADVARSMRDLADAQAERNHRNTGALGNRAAFHVGRGRDAFRGFLGDADERRNRAMYAFNVRDIDRYRDDGGRKTLEDYRVEYLDILERDRERGGDIGDAERAMLDDLALAARLAVRADADRRLAQILAAGDDDWLYDDSDRALAETEALESIPVADELAEAAKGRGLTDADFDAPAPGAEAAADVPDDAPEAIGYVRVDPLGGPDADEQTAAIVKAAARKGWRARIFTDHAGGTTADKRPNLSAAMRAMDTGDHPALIVARLDRIARSAPVVGRVLERAQRRGWTLRALDIGLDTGTAAGRRRAADLIEVGSWGRVAMSEATKAGMRRAAEQGRLPGRKRLDPETVALLRRLRAEGMTYRAMADHLNAEGIPTAQGGRWHDRTIRRILAREQEGTTS